MDLDFIKVAPTFPAKMYLNLSNSDNYKLDRMYTQYAVKFGYEYRAHYSGYYMKTGFALYKEKKTDKNPSPKAGFLPPLSEFGLGYKKHFPWTHPINFNFNLEFDMLSPFKFLKNDLNKSPKISTNIEIPLYIRETNTEALRQLIYTEKERKSNKNKKEQTTGDRTLTLEKLLNEKSDKNYLDDPGLNSFFNQKENNALYKKRQKLLKKLDELDNNKDYEKP